jgi:hypothetical protein
MSEQPDSDQGERWEVFRQPDGLWRWRWLPAADESDADPLISAETFDKRQSAQEAARSAFPDLPGSVDAPRSPVAAAREAAGSTAAWAGRAALRVGLLGLGYLVGRRSDDHRPPVSAPRAATAHRRGAPPRSPRPARRPGRR